MVDGHILKPQDGNALQRQDLAIATVCAKFQHTPSQPPPLARSTGVVKKGPYSVLLLDAN